MRSDMNSPFSLDMCSLSRILSEKRHHDRSCVSSNIHPPPAARHVHWITSAWTPGPMSLTSSGRSLKHGVAAFFLVDKQFDIIHNGQYHPDSVYNGIRTLVPLVCRNGRDLYIRINIA